MADTAVDAFVHQVRPAAGEPRGALILFHGRATNEYDLLPLADELDPARELVAITPRGPVSLPPGGAHWYRILQVGFPDPVTFGATYAALSEWVDAITAAHGVPLSRTILSGFSQGTVMAYALGLGRGRPSPAGILALSGFIPTVEGWEPDLESRRRLGVAIAHGTYDPIISVQFARRAHELLEQAEVDVLYRESPIDHGIDPRVLPELREWVGSRVAASG